jgi:hypothetical protein
LQKRNHYTYPATQTPIRIAFLLTPRKKSPQIPSAAEPQSLFLSDVFKHKKPFFLFLLVSMEIYLLISI